MSRSSHACSPYCSLDAGHRGRCELGASLVFQSEAEEWDRHANAFVELSAAEQDRVSARKLRAMATRLTQQAERWRALAHEGAELRRAAKARRASLTRVVKKSDHAPNGE